LFSARLLDVYKLEGIWGTVRPDHSVLCSQRNGSGERRFDQAMSRIPKQVLGQEDCRDVLRSPKAR
jgi:hypothetical protein